MDGSDSAIGRTTCATGAITPQQADMIGATLRPHWQAGTLAEGDVLPHLWHWAAFAPPPRWRNLAQTVTRALAAFSPIWGWGGGCGRVAACGSSRRCMWTRC